MVLLLQTFNKLCSKLDHHHNRHGCRASFSVSRLQAFEDVVSSCLNQLLLSSPEPKLLSFHWLCQLLQALPILHQAFAKLVVDLEYPVGKWGAELVDGYLNYSVDLLDLLNSISFSLSQLGQSRLSLSYALSLIQSSPSKAVSRLRPIVPKRHFKGLENRGAVKDQKRKVCYGEEWTIEKALATVEGIGSWVCGIVLSACEGDSTAFLEMRKSAAGVAVPAFKALDSVIFAVVSGKGSVPEEVQEVNGAAEKIIGGSGEAAEEMRRRLGRLEKEVERLGKEVDGRFSEVLEGRSRLLDVFRQPNHIESKID